jgi:6-pyruvoyltetrahydropterin/6-carboxytetrahydropterin synthase
LRLKARSVTSDDQLGTQRHVTVEGVRLRFAAAHMATLGDDLEPLHGHNYEVSCRVEGDLTSDQWVIDFSVIKRVVREACEQLDHRFLLQRASTLLTIEEAAASWTVRFGSREYVFPRSDVAALPIENTTAELLAEWIWSRVAEVLEGGDHSNIRTLSVEVEEMPGQRGGYARGLAVR